MPLLDQIHSPSDLKTLSVQDLGALAEEIRQFLVLHVSQTGGHLASNLGVVELTLALHYVFESPKDKLIFDVGHQSYIHKILTGRKDLFVNLRKKDGMSGFTRRYESAHDILNTGHASNSISFGLGLLTAQEIKNENHKVICVIGDGGLTGGMALAGLNNAGKMGKNLIVVVNDNQMSISKNVGALHDYLSRLTATKSYHRIRRIVDHFLPKIPFIGGWLYLVVLRIKRSIKGMFFKQTLFSDLGFEYVGPIHGHHLKDLITVLQNAAAIDRPVVVHTVTQKGHGYAPAIKEPRLYHGVIPFDAQVGIKKEATSTKRSFTSVITETLLELGKKDQKIVAVTAAMPDGTGLSLFAKMYPDRFFDTGIAEEHAVTFAAGMAAAGLKPIVAIYSTFMQRAVDQVIHDVAMQGNLRIVFILDRAGLVPGDGENHQGVYDLAIFRSIPNLNILAPATGNELHNMIAWALRQKRSSLIRYPKESLPPEEIACEEPIQMGCGVFVREEKKAKILIISVGGILSEVLLAADSLKETHKIATDIYNLRFISPCPEANLQDHLRRYNAVLVIEEATKNGGIGEAIAGMCVQMRQAILFEHMGVGSEFIKTGDRTQLLKMAGLSKNHIVKNVLKIHKESRVRQFATKIAEGKILS
ncbi:MAG: 1-deoxy-D-xylulose-5-phosphate synthase [Spirochaetia bacterium]